MKKVFLLNLAFSLIFTNLVFAEPTSDVDGKKRDVSSLTLDGLPLERGRVSLADPATVAAQASVKNSQLTGSEYALAVRPIIQRGILDSFARLRISNPVTIFDSTLQYGKQPLFWEEWVAGGGTSTHLPNQSAVQMAVGTASGDKTTRQTHRYIRYQPGKSQLVMMTALLNASKANLRQRLGQFDDNNGLYFDLTSTGFQVCIRTFTSGSVVNNCVLQSSFNADKLDGTGASGITLDITKTQIFFFDYEWLSVGPVRFGIFINSLPVYLHIFRNENSQTVPYSTTMNLPLRIEIENTGTTASSSALNTICYSVIAEGSASVDSGLPQTASNGITPIAVTTRRPVLSIRPRLLFNSIANRAEITLKNLRFRTTINDSFCEIVYGGALTGASFADVDTTYSTVQKDVAATAITGGQIVSSAFAISGTGSTAELADLIIGEGGLAFGLDHAASVQDILSVVCTSFSGTSNISATLDWVEHN